MATLTMYDEAMIILNICASEGFPEAVVLQRPASFETNRIRVYYVDGLDAYNPDLVIRKIHARVQAMLNKAWNRGRFYVRMVPSLPLRIEVPLPTHAIHFQPLWPVIKGLKGKGHGRPLLLLGETYEFDVVPEAGENRTGSISVVDMSESSTAHVLLAAATGGGKSRLLKNVILSMAAVSSPRDVRMLVFDPKADDFAGFALPHLAAPVLTDPDESLVALRALVAEMERRKAIAKAIPPGTPDAERSRMLGPYIVAFIDELTDLVTQAGPESEEIIMRLLQKARAMKINLFLATQRPAVGTIKRVGEMRSNLTVRIVGAIAEPEHAKSITGLAGSTVQANALNKGDFILVINGIMRRFHAFGIDNEVVPNITAALTRTWGDAGRGWMLDMQAGQPATGALGARASAAPASEPGGHTLVPAGVPGFPNRTQKAAVSDRHAVIVEAIKAEATARGEWPSGHWLREWHKANYQKDLNPETARNLIARAQGGQRAELTY